MDEMYEAAVPGRHDVALNEEEWLHSCFVGPGCSFAGVLSWVALSIGSGPRALRRPSRRGGASGGMAGVPGFEPGNAGIKTQCLTAWLHP